MAIHIHPLDLPPRYYKPIGQIAASWNLTDALIQSVIWHIHKIRNVKVGRLFTYRPTSVERLNMFKVSAEKFVPDPSTRADMRRIHREADFLRGRRNTIIHALWGRMPNEPKIWKAFFIKNTDDTFMMRRETIALADLQDLAARMRRLNVSLNKLSTSIGAPPP